MNNCIICEDGSLFNPWFESIKTLFVNNFEVTRWEVELPISRFACSVQEIDASPNIENGYCILLVNYIRYLSDNQLIAFVPNIIFGNILCDKELTLRVIRFAIIHPRIYILQEWLHYILEDTSNKLLDWGTPLTFVCVNCWDYLETAHPLCGVTNYGEPFESFLRFSDP